MNPWLTAAAGFALLAVFILVDRRFSLRERLDMVGLWAGALLAAVVELLLGDGVVLRHLWVLYVWIVVATGFRPAVATASSLELSLPEGEREFVPRGRYEQTVVWFGPWLLILGVVVAVVALVIRDS